MTPSSLKEIITQNGLLVEDHFLITLSGGVDSVVLFHLFLRAGITISVAHCNFNLRGEDSDLDEAFVKALCEDNNVPCFVKHFETKNISEAETKSIQMIARELRYSWFEKLRIEQNIDWVVTAHHLTDHIETVLLNFTRGTGIAGLHGIKPLSGKIFRPLLDFTKEDCYAFAKENKIDWREDVSNKSVKYKRNRVRNEVLPLLRKVNANFEHTAKETIEKLSYTEAIFNQQVKKLKKEIQDGNQLKVSQDLINEQDGNPILFFEILKAYGFSYHEVKQWLFNAEKMVAGKFFLSSPYVLLKTNEAWVLQKQEEQNTVSHVLELNKPIEILGKQYLLEEIDYSEVVFGKDSEAIFFSPEKVDSEIIIRTWRNGDRFSPLGMKGEKKISDFLIDEKVSLLEKSSVLVLEHRNEILAVVGKRINEQHKLKPNTGCVYRLQIGE